MRIKGIIFGILVAFGFAEFVGKYLVLILGVSLGVGDELISTLIDANYILSIVLGILVYKYYAKKEHTKKSGNIKS